MSDRAAMPETGLSETEVEVTPAMIEAGVVELCGYDPEHSDRREMVAAILQAALASRLRFRRLELGPCSDQSAC
jgi:hypothetical protein